MILVESISGSYSPTPLLNKLDQISLAILMICTYYKCRDRIVPEGGIMATTEKQRESVRKYEDQHDRITIMCSKGTRDRIAALGLGSSAPRFAAFATEFMLNYCERRRDASV